MKIQSDTWLDFVAQTAREAERLAHRATHGSDPATLAAGSLFKLASADEDAVRADCVAGRYIANGGTVEASRAAAIAELADIARRYATEAWYYRNNESRRDLGRVIPAMDLVARPPRCRLSASSARSRRSACSARWAPASIFGRSPPPSTARPSTSSTTRSEPSRPRSPRRGS